MDNSYHWTDHVPAATATYLERNPAQTVELLVADFVGSPRGLTLPAGRFAQKGAWPLPSSIFSETVSGAGDLQTGPDIRLVPDLSTAIPMPWARTATLQIIGQPQDAEGRPMGVAPRQVLARVGSYFAEQGWAPTLHARLDVHVSDETSARDHGLEDAAHGLIEEIFSFAQTQGIALDAVTPTGVPGVLAVSFAPAAPVVLADAVFFTKRMIRALASKHSTTASFMAWSGTHQGLGLTLAALVADKNARNLFASDTTPTAEAQHFVAGLQAYLPAAALLVAPYVNSYRRLRPLGLTALTWSDTDRTAAINGAGADAIATRVPGADCNPYLAIAATLAAGYLGLIENRPPATGTMPRSAPAALEILRETHKLRMILGEEFARAYETVKTRETEELLGEITPWEVTHLSHRV